MTTLALPNYSALGSIVTNDLDRYRAGCKVQEAGWRWLGDGAACDAYLSPTGDRVIKLVNGDDGQRATLDAALAHPDNPHLPRVYGMLDLDNGHWAVETEVLEPGHAEHRSWSRQWSNGNGRRVADGVYDRILSAPDCPMKEAILALDAAAREYGPAMCWDCHDGNLMVRPGTGEVVLNDLLYGGGSDYDLIRCERCDERFDFETEGAHVHDEPWCDACVNEHAVYCQHEGAFVPASEDDAKAVRAYISFAGFCWHAEEGRVAADNREAFAENGNVWDEAAQAYVEAQLHAVLTAITGLAQEALAQHIEPRLPFARAA